MDNPKTLLIIGGGIAGLAAGCYARLNGFRVRIFELHTIPGGLCTSWRRQGYLFDGAIRYLVGAGPKVNAHLLWKELGMLEGRRFHFYDEFTRYEDGAGRAFCLYTDVDKLEAHMLALSAEDAAVTRDFIGALRDFAAFDLPVDLTPDDPQENLQLGMMMLPYVGPLLRWKDVTLRDFAERFRDPLLRDGLLNFFQFTPPDFPLMMLVMTLAQLANKSAGYPIGGSLDFAEDLTRRYKKLGGEIQHEARVTRILVENDQAVGVRLADGSEQRGDLVIAACDLRSTLYDLLDGDYLTEQLKLYFQVLPPSESILQVSLGVARDFSAEPPSLSFPLRRAIRIGERGVDRLVVKHYSFDPTMADAGKASLNLWLEADYDYWQRLRAEPEHYEAEKQTVAENVIAALDERFPALAAQVEAVDVATPVTFERYTANWHGAIHGWALGMKKMNLMMGTGMSKTLPGLKHFYLIGQWIEPGGNVQLAAASGRDAVEMICRAEERPFVTAANRPAPVSVLPPEAARPAGESYV
jgi:phytoene dehydrogenase-like protein